MQVEGYSNIELISNGDHNRVYYAIRESDQVAVSLKTPSSPFPDARNLSSLKREFQILKSLKGNGLPEALDFVRTKNSGVLVRSWIEGQTLRKYQQAEPVSLLHALELAISVTRRIGELHRQSYCHRDISPNNILIAPDGDQVFLIDYDSSVIFTDRARRVVKSSSVEGSRSYMSPEQTGRMNRGLDFRTDFYSLGVIFYELFTKTLPFTTTDTNELIYNHIALEPRPLTEVDAAIPELLSDLVLKLMSKDPDNRYQSAEGIEADLCYCLAQYQATGRITGTTLGSADLNDRFLLPEKLYGRQEETTRLTEAFEQADAGEGQLVFVAGPSGVGKTSLVRELYRPLAGKGGYIATGKYDQFLRHQPYSAILQALSGLIRQLMAEDAETIARWRSEIINAIGSNGAILTEVLPELELLTGPQPAVAKLSLEATSDRFNTTFFNLLHCFGQSEKPIVLFLDDLQWVDYSSLALLEGLAPSLSRSHFVIIGAYRSNEVLSGHPLAMAMTGLQEACANTRIINLSDLPSQAMTEMLADTFQLPPEGELSKLSEHLLSKTHGNPLFLRAMLTNLYTSEAVWFDYGKRSWRWDLKAIMAAPYADNVAEMLQAHLTRLPENTLTLLKTAGCIGHQFSLGMLSQLNGDGITNTARELIPAIAKGYVQLFELDFELLTEVDPAELHSCLLRFAHDRIQQAACDMLPDQEREQLHWKIGQQLRQQMNFDDSAELLFDAAEHLNQGGRCASDDERRALIGLNLKAADKARQSAAYRRAHILLTHAKACLSKNSWQQDYSLTAEVYTGYAQACYLVSEFDEAEACFKELREKVRTEQDRLRVCTIQAKQYHHQGRYQQSIGYELEALELLGITLPDDDQALMERFGEEQSRIQTLMEQKGTEWLLAQPEDEDPDMLLTHELCFNTFTDAYLLGRGPVLAVVAAISTRLSLERGSCRVTSAGLINYATILCSGGDYRTGHEIGRVAVQLADKYASPAYKNYTYHVFALGINHWLEPLHTSHYYWHQASRLSLESGSPYAGWVFLQLPHVMLASGTPLDEVIAQAETSLEYLNSQRMSDIATLLKLIVLQPLRHLKGETLQFTSMDDKAFSLSETLENYKDAPFFLGHTAYSWLRASLMARHILPKSELDQWLPVIENTVQAQIIQVDSCLYTGLHLAAACTELEGEEKQVYLEAITIQLKKFEGWAELCPANFKHKYLMLKGEVARLEGDYMAAMEYYDSARESALEARFLHDAALCDELTGIFWQQLDKQYQAQIYLRRSMAGYEQWGASGKVSWMQEYYPELAEDKAAENPGFYPVKSLALESEDFSAILDMGSVIKASQAISQHIHLEKLAEELLSLAIENAGATRGMLLLKQDDDFVVTKRVECGDGVPDERLVSLSEAGFLSQMVVRYVINSGTTVVLPSQDADEQFERCPYLSSHSPVSVLCIPLVRQKAMSGVLYLENTMLADAFQSDRIHTLKIISSQAAISLENARMYRDLEKLNKNLEQLVEERTRKLYEANNQLQAKNKELAILSTTDQLTGLYNRRYIEDKLIAAIEQSRLTEEVFSVLMLDLDYFKSVNDTFGHDMGDRVLLNIASLLKTYTQDGDVAGRWGGEEFIVICRSPQREALAHAQRLREKIMQTDHGPCGQVTTSIGVVQYQPGDSLNGLLKRVDRGLYKAKEAGRNQIVTENERIHECT